MMQQRLFNVSLVSSSNVSNETKLILDTRTVSVYVTIYFNEHSKWQTESMETLFTMHIRIEIFYKREDAHSRHETYCFINTSLIIPPCLSRPFAAAKCNTSVTIAETSWCILRKSKKVIGINTYEHDRR